MLERAYKFLEKRFEAIIIRDQDLLSIPTHQAKFIRLLPKAENNEEIKRAFAKCSTGEERWQQYLKVIERLQSANNKVLHKLFNPFF